MTRLEAYVERRTREALSAAIEPFSTEFDRAHAGLEAIGDAWSRRLFDGPFYLSPAPPGDLPAANLVFVRSRDGDTVADNPSTLGGGEADKHLIYEGLSRVAADGVLSGAATIHGSEPMLRFRLKISTSGIWTSRTTSFPTERPAPTHSWSFAMQ